MTPLRIEDQGIGSQRSVSRFSFYDNIFKRKPNPAPGREKEAVKLSTHVPKQELHFAGLAVKAMAKTN